MRIGWSCFLESQVILHYYQHNAETWSVKYLQGRHSLFLCPKTLLSPSGSTLSVANSNNPMGNFSGFPGYGWKFTIAEYYHTALSWSNTRPNARTAPHWEYTVPVHRKWQDNTILGSTKRLIFPRTDTGTWKKIYPSTANAKFTPGKLTIHQGRFLFRMLAQAASLKPLGWWDGAEILWCILGSYMGPDKMKQFCQPQCMLRKQRRREGCYKDDSLLSVHPCLSQGCLAEVCYRLKHTLISSGHMHKSWRFQTLKSSMLQTVERARLGWKWNNTRPNLDNVHVLHKPDTFQTSKWFHT